MTSGVQLAMKRANTSNTAPSILTVCMRVNLSQYVYINTRSMCAWTSISIHYTCTCNLYCVLC